MARFSRLTVYGKMRETGMVPVFYHADLQVCKDVLKACYEGGARVFEFTNRGDFAHEVFGELVKWAAKELPEMILGIGSIVDPGTAALYIQSGANFIVGPVLNIEVAKACNRRKIAYSPGCGSLSEISQAEELGVEVVKIFPAMQVGGPSFVEAVLGPMPWSSIMPTGGVEPEEENLKKWFNAGVICVGMGSKLMVKTADGGFNLEGIRAKTKEAIAIISQYKKNKLL